MERHYVPDGGPAFPRPVGHNGLSHVEEHYANDDQRGMSLRDYFAGQVIAGMFADGASFGVVVTAASTEGASPSLKAAGIAYDIADAMLKARQR